MVEVFLSLFGVLSWWTASSGRARRTLFKEGRARPGAVLCGLGPQFPGSCKKDYPPAISTQDQSCNTRTRDPTNHSQMKDVQMICVSVSAVQKTKCEALASAPSLTENWIKIWPTLYSLIFYHIDVFHIFN